MKVIDNRDATRDLQAEGEAALREMADRQTGTDPLEYLRILNNLGKLPVNLDPRLIVIPLTWGERRH